MSSTHECPHRWQIITSREKAIACTIRSDIPHETHFAMAKGTTFMWSTGSLRDFRAPTTFTGTYELTIETREGNELPHPDRLESVLRNSLLNADTPFERLDFELLRIN